MKCGRSKADPAWLTQWPFDRAMLTGNSTDEILDDVQRQLDLHAAKEEKPGQPPPAAGRSVRALASSTTTKRKPTASKGRQRQVEPLGDDALDDTDEKRRRRAGGFNHCTHGSIPAFITPALLALQIGSGGAVLAAG